VAWVGEQPGAQAIYLGVKFQSSSGALLRTLTELLEAAAFG
jgi:uracil-DNA glycosylase